MSGEVPHCLTFYQGNLNPVPPNLWVDVIDPICPICAMEVSQRFGKLRENKLQHQLYHLTLKTMITGDPHV